MKTKLTVTVDDELLPRAKRYARLRNQSLSAVIEDALRKAVDQDEDFVEKWRGQFAIQPRNEPRFRYLQDKAFPDSD